MIEFLNLRLRFKEKKKRKLLMKKLRKIKLVLLRMINYRCEKVGEEFIGMRKKYELFIIEKIMSIRTLCSKFMCT